MSPESRQHVRASWRLIEGHTERFAETFCAHLFEIDPQIRGMFADTDMTAHQQKFVDMLRGLVAALETPPDLVARLAASGRRHAGYGVRDEHYATVGSALLWSLERCMGPDFDTATRQAWRELYNLIAAIMRRGADRLPEDNAHSPRADCAGVDARKR